MSIELEFICCPVCGALYVIGKHAGCPTWNCPHVFSQALEKTRGGLE